MHRESKFLPPVEGTPSSDAQHDGLAELGYEAAHPALQSALWRDAQDAGESTGYAL